VRDAGGPVRMGFMFSEASYPSLEAVGLKSGFGDDRVRATSIKVFHGNSLSGRTGWLSEPYSDQPQYCLVNSFDAVHGGDAVCGGGRKWSMKTSVETSL
jgi:predicted amidohydrolase YtcJ